jgi:hypothetical protein
MVAFGSISPRQPGIVLAGANWRLSSQELPAGPAGRWPQALPMTTGHELPFHETRDMPRPAGSPGLNCNSQTHGQVQT